MPEDALTPEKMDELGLTVEQYPIHGHPGIFINRSTRLTPDVFWYMSTLKDNKTHYFARVLNGEPWVESEKGRYREFPTPEAALAALYQWELKTKI